MKPKLIVEVPGAGEKEIQPALAVLKAAAGEAYDIEIKVRLPESRINPNTTTYTFVLPHEVGPLLAALAPDDRLHVLRDRLMGHIHDLTDEMACKYRGAAQDLTRDGEIEIDNNAIVSVSDDGGAYVQSWLWVSDKEAGVDQDREDNSP